MSTICPECGHRLPASDAEARLDANRHLARLARRERERREAAEARLAQILELLDGYPLTPLLVRIVVLARGEASS